MIFKILNKDKLINKFLPIFSIIFFLFWRFFFNFLLWRNRILPPEPGDVFNYFRFIRLIEINYLKLTPFYLAYSVILGNIARIFSLTPEKVFYYTFYLGFILLAIVLWHFFKKLNFKPIQITLCFFLLAFYTGHGSFHGFYWVVPSFFVFLIFLYLFSNLISSEKINWWLTGILAFILPLFHRLGFPLIIIFLLYFIFYTLFRVFPKFSWQNFKEKFDFSLVKRMVFIISLSTLSFLLFSLLLPLINQKSSPEMQIFPFTSEIPFLRKYYLSQNIDVSPSLIFFQKLSQGFLEFRFAYLDYVVPNFFFFVIWLIIFIILFYYRKHQLVAFYWATFIFSLFSSLIYWRGFRSVLLLWPITYILVGVAFYYFYQFLKENSFFLKKIFFKKIFFSLLIFLVIGFYIFNIAYSFYYIDLKNKEINIPFNPRMFDNLIASYSSKDSVLFFDDYLPLNYFLYRYYEKKYFVCTSLEVCLKKMRTKEANHLILVLTDKQKIYQIPQKEIIFKKILKNILSLLNNDAILLKGASKEIVSDRRLEIFKFEEKLNSQKLIYQDEYFYIFEIFEHPNL